MRHLLPSYLTSYFESNMICTAVSCPEIFETQLPEVLIKPLARPGREKSRKHVRDVRDFNNIETRAVIMSFFLQDKAPKEIHAILT